MTARPDAPAIPVCIGPDGITFAGHSWKIPSLNDPDPDPLMPQDWRCQRCQARKPRPETQYGSAFANAWPTLTPERRRAVQKRWTNR